MEAVVNSSSNCVTSSGRVDWFVFLSSVNSSLRINPDAPLGIGPDLELCFSLADAAHAVTFSCEGNTLFITPEVGELSLDGERILQRIAVEPNTTLCLGDVPVFIATSPVLETVPQLRARKRVEPKVSVGNIEDSPIAKVVQLPSRLKPNLDNGTASSHPIAVPATVPSVTTQPMRRRRLWAWALGFALCLLSATFATGLRHYVPITLPEAEAVAPPTLLTDTLQNTVTAPPVLALNTDAVTVSPISLSTERKLSEATQTPDTVVEQPATVPVNVHSTLDVVASVPVVATTSPAVVATPRSIEPELITALPTPNPNPNPQKAYAAIEEVNSEHLLVAAQWAMRNSDGPGALILLEAITTKSPDDAQAIALRDQLRWIMAEVELENTDVRNTRAESN